MIVSIAMIDSGELHILPAEMPTAENLIAVEIEKIDGVWTIARDDVERLRQLIGAPMEPAPAPARRPSLADELDDMLTSISAVVQRRIDQLRGDDDELSVPPRA